MSRCFPYPPPHYHESLIKSIKINKEKEKAEKVAKSKAKDKKEKKREKREKKREKVNQIQVNSKHEEKTHKKRKFEDNSSLSDKKALYCQQTINDAGDQLEGSGLTEEHEMPCFVKYKHDSPESSQDSNKRRKVISSLSSHNVHGSVLRIKLSSSKQGVDSISQLPPTLRQGVDPGSQLHPTLRHVGDSVPPHLQPTSRHGRDSSHPQFLPTSSGKERDSGSRIVTTSSQGGNSASRFLPTPRLEGDSGSQLLQNSLLGRNTASQLLPTSGKSRDSCLQGSQLKPGLPFPSSKQINPEPAAAQTAAHEVPPAAKLKLLPHDQHAVDEQPCFSGRSKETASADQEVTVPSSKKKSSRSKREGGRRWQKEQFKDLVENWNPPSLQMESSDTADDWLLATPKQRSTTKSSVVSEVGSGCGSDTIPPQQPRACYIPELEMYQLPYVVPF